MANPIAHIGASTLQHLSWTAGVRDTGVHGYILCTGEGNSRHDSFAPANILWLERIVVRSSQQEPRPGKSRSFSFTSTTLHHPVVKIMPTFIQQLGSFTALFSLVYLNATWDTGKVFYDRDQPSELDNPSPNWSVYVFFIFLSRIFRYTRIRFCQTRTIWFFSLVTQRWIFQTFYLEFSSCHILVLHLHLTLFIRRPFVIFLSFLNKLSRHLWI